MSCSHHILRHTVHKQMPETRADCPALISFSQGYANYGGLLCCSSSQPQKLLVSLVLPHFSEPAADIRTHVLTG